MGIPFTFTAEQRIDLVVRFEAGEPIPSLMERFGCGRNRLTRELKELLDDRYAEVARHVMLLAQSRGQHARKGKPGVVKSPEWIAKIAAGNRGKRLSVETRAKIGDASRRADVARTPGEREALYAKVVATKRERGTYEECGRRHAEWMLEHAPMRGKHHSAETCAQISTTKRTFYQSGGIPNRRGTQHSIESKTKMQAAALQMWSDGKFSYGDDSTMRSKLEKRVFAVITAACPDAKHSFVVRGATRVYVFDACVPSRNLLIEVNGDYWHLNPALYEASHRDKNRDVIAQELWDRDTEKRVAGESSGRRVVVLWERDLLQMSDEQIMEAVLESTNVDNTGR